MAPEIIKSDDVIERSSVSNLETKGDLAKIYAAISVVLIALLIGCVTIVLSVLYAKPELQTWATSMISGIVGGAIGYGFNSRANG